MSESKTDWNTEAAIGSVLSSIGRPLDLSLSAFRVKRERDALLAFVDEIASWSPYSKSATVEACGEEAMRMLDEVIDKARELQCKMRGW